MKTNESVFIISKNIKVTSVKFLQKYLRFKVKSQKNCDLKIMRSEQGGIYLAAAVYVHLDYISVTQYFYITYVS